MKPHALPLALLLSGAPGSGKTTLARQLGDVLRVPVIEKDRLREGTLWSLPTRDLDDAPPGPPLWYDVMEHLLGLGISVVGDMALFAGVSERDINTRLSPLADIFNVHCIARDSSSRLIERAHTDPLQAHRLTWLETNADTWHDQTAEPLELACPRLVVDTSDGYAPSLEAIVESVTSFADKRS